MRYFRGLLVLTVGLALPGTSLAAPLAAGSSPRVVIETTLGDVVVELYPDRTPVTVENFLTYAREGHYDGTIVYRVTGFLIQAGSTNPDFSRRPTRDPIPNEADASLRNERGTVGMARYAPHTATAEFYVNTSDNAWLDHQDKTDEGWGYCVFGRVVQGMDVVDAIAALPAGPRANLQDVPKEEVTIKKVRLADEGSPTAVAPPESPPPEPQTVRLRGVLTDEGVECQAMTGDDGRLYTLVGDLSAVKVGDRVEVTGKRAEISTCQQGVTIEVESIRRTGGSGMTEIDG
jgi:cyclophilin family peptidyl-prolyl cis-trans isomerase